MLKMKKITETYDMRVFTDNGEYSHSAALLFLSPSKQVIRYLYGLSYQPLDFGFLNSTPSPSFFIVPKIATLRTVN